MLTQMEELEEEVSCLARLVTSDYFDYSMATLLCLNALFIGVQVEVMSQQTSPHPLVGFQVIDVLFTLAFLVELILRLIAFGFRFFTMSGWQWHWFDLFVVMFSVADELTKYVFAGSDLDEVVEKLGVLRLLRLGRVIRLVRMVRLIPSLKSLVYLISASMNSFFWTSVLLLILMYVVSVYFTELATDLKHGGVTNLDDWSSIGSSVMTLFQAISGGADWRDLVENFPEQTYTLNVTILAMYVAFATLVMLNLVTGVFVEGAQRIAKEERQRDLIKVVRSLHAIAETSGDGEVSWSEFEGCLESKAMQDFLKAFDMDAHKAKAIFEVVDTDKSGTISLEEFVSAATTMHGPVKLADTEIIRLMIKDSFAEVFSKFESIEAALNDDQCRKKRQSPSTQSMPMYERERSDEGSKTVTHSIAVMAKANQAALASAFAFPNDIFHAHATTFSFTEEEV